MSDLIVTEFVTLDDVVEDPDGRAGTPGGGWAFRHGEKAVAGDKFDLGPLFETGVMLFGRTTWEHFSKLWPSRTGPFADRMNAIPKVVVSKSLTSADAWQNSSVTDDLVSTVRALKARQDIVVVGSISVVRALAEHGLVDEYRLMVFPTVLGAGERLFTVPGELRLTSVEQKGSGALMRYRTDT
ncbi:dihydrofolate reductase family protein [Lentzea sp. NPDC059081]|uniref:dihydrofolate reductase family protein n=1 Tax=Lentzea sp. NPDC059081 TaxID=3346719 RepID=UPI0036B5E288